MRILNLTTIVLSAIVFLSCDNKVQSGKNDLKDSLEIYFEIANNEALSDSLRLTFNRKAHKIVSDLTNDSITRMHLFKVANRYYNVGSIDDYGATTQELILRSKVAKDSAAIAKGYSYLADYYIEKTLPDSAYKYNHEAEKIYGIIQDYSNQATSLLNQAILQQRERDYLGCERTVFKLLRILEKAPDEEMFYQANNMLGIIYAEIGEFDLSIQYYNKVLQIALNNNLPAENQLVANTYNNIGLLYNKQNFFEKATDKFRLGLSQPNLNADTPNLSAKLKDNLGYAQMKLGNYKLAERLFLESIKIRDSLNNNPGIILSRLHLSEYFLSVGNREDATMHATIAYQMAISEGEERDLLPVLRGMAEVNPQNALQYFKQYNAINDSLQLAERKIRNKLARIEYETENLEKEKEDLVEQRKILITVAFVVILIATLVFVIRIQSAKNRELRLVQEQQKANEEIFHLMISQQDKVEEERQKEKKRIAQELHDGVLGKLFGTRMNLGILNDSRNDNTTVAHRGAFIEDLKTIEQELREISHDLSREQQAVQNNFVLMVSNFIESQRTVCPAGISYSMDNCIIWAEVGNNTKINLYRILQEAFQNINKHSQASAVSVVFEQSKMGISLLIADNGVGFNYSKKRNGIGLQNMQNRISNSAGTMKITTTAGSGTELYFDVPLNPA